MKKNNKTGVEYIDIRYVKNNSVTVCKLNCKIDIRHFSLFYGLNHQMAEKFIKYVNELGMTYSHDGLYFSTKGLARLNSEDTYNEVVGERISLSKAQTLAFSKANRMYCMLGNLVEAALDELDVKVDGTCNVCEHCENHVNELIEETN